MSNISNAQNKILNRLFRKVEGVVWDLSSNSIGLQNNNGITTLVQTPVAATENAAASVDFTISVNPFDSFGFAIPAFAQLTKLSDVSVGDIVIGDTKALGWVTAVREKSLRLLDQSGMGKDYTPPKTAVLNQDGALVVKPLTGLFGEQGASGFGNALLPLMLMGDGGLGGLDDILPIMLLTQQTAGNNSNALASALPTILMMKSLKGGNGGMKDMLLPMIMMGGLGGGAGGINPMMLMALSGEGGLSGLGGTGQFIAGDVPALHGRQASPVQNATPALQRLR